MKLGREFKLVRERAEKIPLEAAKRAEVADTRARYDATLAAWRRRENNADKTLSLTGEPAAEGAPAGEECVTEEALKWLAAGWAKAVKAVLEEQLAVQDTTRQAKRQQQKERDAEEQVVLLKEDKMDEVMQVRTTPSSLSLSLSLSLSVCPQLLFALNYCLPSTNLTRFLPIGHPGRV